MKNKKILFLAALFLAGAFFAGQPVQADWCHTFNANLKFGSQGAEIFHLKTALIKEGFGRSLVIDNKFDSKTFAAVVAFQKKHKILSTGNVASLTRAKLNKLYGCAVSAPAAPAPAATSSAVLLSPNGGEKLTQGSAYSITWKASGSEKVTLTLINYSVGDQTVIADSISASSSQYSWQIPYSLYGGNYYKISVKAGNASDLSDNYFSIGVIQKPLAPSITLLSPNGGEQWEKGKTYSVKWLYQDLNGIEISLTDYAKNETYSLANNVGASLNSYDWSIPSFANTVPAGSQYKVKIKGCSGSSCYTDESDNYFSVAAAVGAGAIENRLAEISSAVDRLVREIRELLERE